MLKLALTKLGLKRLERTAVKVARCVLRGRRRWQHLLCYPTLVLTITGLLIFNPCVYGDESDMEWVQGLAADNQRIFMDNLKEMMEMPGFDENLKAEALKPRPRLQIFVSHSMPISLLKRYAREAIKYKGVLVLRGLPAGSFHKLSKLVSDISGDDAEGIAMQIDDEAFKAFDVKSVPTIVLSKQASIFSEQVKGGSFDKIVGNVTIKYALELFAKEGDLKANALELLK
ncbi:type-F conjugative transfer system pilin assembly protein TrbC (plasmid) [Candidatus Megaera polyxenophila]|nr:type-F conjugative transfer system pilin assembly protein TrbC [Candidatus Megaera polyxenophila]